MKFMVTPDIDDAKKSQLADTVIAGRGTAERARARQGKRERKKELRKKANYCRIVKKLKTRNEPCGAVFNVSRYRDEINNMQIGGGTCRRETDVPADAIRVGRVGKREEV